MRRIKLILAVAAMMVVSVVESAPAMASHDYDGWWDSCGWSWSWWWGWFVVCEPEYGPGYYDGGDDVVTDYGDDDVATDYGDDSSDYGDDVDVSY